MASSFRHSAGFGKRIEYWVVGLMLKAGLDVYLPLVDDDAIDAVIKFVFYSERLNMIWILSSEELIQESVKNKTGNNIGKHAIGFNGTKTDKITQEKYEYPKERFDKYVCKNKDFLRFKNLGKLDKNSN